MLISSPRRREPTPPTRALCRIKVLIKPCSDRGGAGAGAPRADAIGARRRALPRPKRTRGRGKAVAATCKLVAVTRHDGAGRGQSKVRETETVETERDEPTSPRTVAPSYGGALAAHRSPPSAVHETCAVVCPELCVRPYGLTFKVPMQKVCVCCFTRDTFHSVRQSSEIGEIHRLPTSESHKPPSALSYPLLPNHRHSPHKQFPRRPQARGGPRV